MILGLLISEKRKLLFNRWVIWGGLACFALILPNIIWQFVHGFPSLELYKNSFTSKNIEKPYIQVIIEQILFTNPILFPLWLAGLIFMILPAGKPYRYMLFAYLILLFIIVSGHSSRPDRIAAIYVFLLAMGSVAFEKWLKTFWNRILFPVMAVLIIAGGLLFAPMFCPVLPPQQLKGLISAMGLHFDLEENKQGEPIPQWLADRIGWQEMTAQVAEVYQDLPEREKANLVLIANNYGEAGALDYYGPKYGLPVVYATHNSYHSWGPPSDTIKTFIAVNISIEDVKDKFDSVEVSKVIHCDDCTRPQKNIQVLILRRPKFSMEKEWKNFKNYN
jgi:hypothetical protein